MNVNLGKTQEVEEFYDSYWPANLPDYKKTIEHVHSLIEKRPFQNALDGGCGTGVCSIALSSVAKQVTAVDISQKSLETAENLSQELKIKNINFKKASLLSLPFKDNSFDLILSWGVIHHTADPLKALDELNRVLEAGGSIILAIYLKTKLTWAQELIRKTCLKSPKFTRKPFIKSVAIFVSLAQKLGKNNQVRDDNPLIESQVEDWFFVPEKHFYTIQEMKENFEKRSLSPKILESKTGRFKSSSCFIIRGTK